MSRYRDARRRRRVREDREIGLASARLTGRLMGSWPELPTPGRFVALPIAVAPTLRAALGDHGGRNWLALHWDVDRDTCVWTDDAKTIHNANPGVWGTLTGHAVMRPILAPYDLGDNGGVAEHWLLCEAMQQRLSVGLAGDILALLGRQSPLPEITIMTALMGTEWVADQLVNDLQRSPRPRVEHDPLTVYERHERRLVRLAAWLDIAAS